jgi:hypothetical protein
MPSQEQVELSRLRAQLARVKGSGPSHTQRRQQITDRIVGIQAVEIQTLAAPRIAIDCGNVISITDTDDGGGDLVSKVIAGAPSAECVAAVRHIVDGFGAENVFVLSKCGTRVQQATMVMLGKADFFARTGLLPRHCLFCTKRTGGQPPARMLPLPPPDDPQLAPLFVAGALVAPGDVGKGALATKYRLTTLIDDRADCLDSFRGEGVGLRSEGGLLLQALWARSAKPSSKGAHLPCWSWQDVLGRLQALLPPGGRLGGAARGTPVQEQEQEQAQAQQEEQAQARLQELPRLRARLQALKGLGPGPKGERLRIRARAQELELEAAAEAANANANTNTPQPAVAAESASASASAGASASASANASAGASASAAPPMLRRQISDDGRRIFAQAAAAAGGGGRGGTGGRGQ